MVFYKDINGQVFGYDELDESQRPFIQQAVDSGYDYLGDTPPPPVQIPATAGENKAIAVYKLGQTDWAVTTDIGNPVVSIPYLTNQAEFIAYRNLVRQIAINPIDGDILWMDIPKAVWGTL